MKIEKNSPCTEAELRWIQLMAGAISLIGMVGLMALLSQSARAESPGEGFRPGNRPLTNPFANPTGQAPSGAKTPFFEDEEDFGDEDLDEQPTFQAPTSGGPRGATPPPSGGGGRGFTPPSIGSTAPSVGSGSVSGGGAAMGATAPVAPIPLDAETGEGGKEIVTDFNFPDADIMDIAKTLGKLTGKNFILDKDVKGRITIISNSPITVSDAWKAFLTALDINGFALIPSGKYIRIARQRDARDKQLKTYTGDFSPDTDALITRVFPLKYIDAEEVARTFRSFMPANSRIIPYDQTNTVIVTDTGSNISKLSKMLEILDVEGYDIGIEVIPVKFASATELSKLIDQLIPGTNLGGAPAPGGGPRFGARGASFSARRTKEGGMINTIIADERTNTLIVHANGKGADQVRELVAKLDQKLPAATGGGRVHVKYLQFADAEQIATTLNNLSGQGGGGGFRPITPGGAGGGTGVNPNAASLFEGNIKVSADKATNSLVITASPSDFATLERVINRIDIPRDEVYVEVVIMEVSLGRSFTFSTNIANPASGIGLITSNDLFNVISNPIGTTGAFFRFQSGKSTKVNIPGVGEKEISSVEGLVRLIQSNSKANVLATPQVIALDNSEAAFESAELIPVPTTTNVQGVGTQTGITKERVSLSIKIKPQINKVSNFVKMDVETKLGDISDRAPPPGVAQFAFATLERTAKTTVFVGDTDTIVLGGLMRDKSSDSVTKIPILGDIPLLGWLFRSKNTSTEKTNLLIFLTPHIVRHYDKVRAILDKKLKERDQFLEKNAGGEDPLRDARDEIIRNLPDIKELTAQRPTAPMSVSEDAAARPVDPEETNSPFTGGRGIKSPPPKPAMPPKAAEAPTGGSPAPEAVAPPPTAPVSPAAPDLNSEGTNSLNSDSIPALPSGT